MDYAPLADLKKALRIADINDDALLQAALDAAREAIDAHCNRTFVFDAVATVRWFDLSDRRAEVDDFYSTTGLVVTVNGVAVPVAVENVSPGYRVDPRNAAALGEPYTALTFDVPYGPTATWALVTASQKTSVAVTAKWGYAAAIPRSVYQACILQASRIFTRKNSPYGVAGSPDLGSELRLLAKVDPDVAVLLAGKVRY
jgi:hypothetical protein